jgi:hypothetical protein
MSKWDKYATEPGKWDKYATEVVSPEAQASMDAGAREVIQAELDKEKDPAARASLTRELARLPVVTQPSAQPAPPVAQPEPTVGEMLRGGYMGAVKGATAGLSKYPVAGIAMVADRLRGGHLSWEDARKYVNQEYDATRERVPGSMLTGELVGGAANAIGTGGTGVLANAGRTALLGGVSGFTNNEDLAEAAQGAGIGAVLGGAAGAAAKGAQRLVKTEAAKQVAAGANKAITAGRDALDTLAPWLAKQGVNIKDPANVVKAAYSIAGKAEQAAKRGAEPSFDALPDAIVKAAKQVKSSWGSKTAFANAEEKLAGDYGDVMEAARNRLKRSVLPMAKEVGTTIAKEGARTAGWYGAGYGLGAAMDAENPEHWGVGAAGLGNLQNIKNSASWSAGRSRRPAVRTCRWVRDGCPSCDSRRHSKAKYAQGAQRKWAV